MGDNGFAQMASFRPAPEGKRSSCASRSMGIAMGHPGRPRRAAASKHERITKLKTGAESYGTGSRQSGV